MNRTDIDFDRILRLSVPERIQLVHDIWDSIAVETPGEVPLTEEEQRMIEERLDRYRRDPGRAIPWEEAKKRLMDSR